MAEYRTQGYINEYNRLYKEAWFSLLTTAVPMTATLFYAGAYLAGRDLPFHDSGALVVLAGGFMTTLLGLETYSVMSRLKVRGTVLLQNNAHHGYPLPRSLAIKQKLHL